MTRFVASCLTVLCMFAVARQVRGAFFQPLGHLPGEGHGSYANDVSADGSVVVGISGTTSMWAFIGEGFRWARDERMVGLGQFDLASAVSADGSVVVGGRGSGYGFAFRWTSENGIVALDALPGDNRSFASGVSADGSVVVGWSSDGNGQEAFRWTSGGGMVGLGHLPFGYTGSRANDVSADSSVVVGNSYGGNRTEAFRWTSERGMHKLGDLPGGDLESEANGVSADGSVVVGSLTTSDRPRQAFRWTNDRGMVGLGDLSGGELPSIAYDVSGDGSIVVGWSDTTNGQAAFVWDAVHGMRSVHQVLTDQGVDLTGWKLNQANAISADGTTIVGSGINSSGRTEAWLANISVVPEPSCLALVAGGVLCLLARRRLAAAARFASLVTGRQRLITKSTLAAVLLAAFCAGAVARADIFRWDNGQLIPGTEEITPGPGVQLSGKHLQWANLFQANLVDATFDSADLTSAYFEEATLTSANLSHSNLRGARLNNASLTNVNLTDAFIDGGEYYTGFEGTTSLGFTKEQLYSTASYKNRDLGALWLANNDLSGWNFGGQRLNSVVFRNSNLTNTDLTDALVNGTDFDGTAVTREQIYSTASYKSHDLHGIRLLRFDLTGWDFRGQDLTDADFGFANFTNANLAGAKLIRAEFQFATLNGADLTGANLYESLLRYAKLNGADLTGANLFNARLNEATLSNAKLTGASLTWADLGGAILANADLTGAVVWGANFDHTTNRGFTKEQLYSTASYQSKNLHGIGLSGNDLSGWDFTGQNLSDADFAGANLTGAIVTGTDLRGTTARGFTKLQLYSTASYQAKDLRGIDFGATPWFGLPSSNLTGWDFCGQNLTNANFNLATLTGANFSGANLTSATFYLANLIDADFTGADTRGARSLEHLDVSGATTTNLIRPDGRIEGLDLAAGEKLVAYAGVPISVQVSGGFSIATSATFDLTDNDLIVHATAETKDSLHAEIQAKIKSAQNGLDANFVTKWDGPGITSSSARTANVAAGLELVGLGVIRNSDLDITTGIPGSSHTSFSGQAVTPDDVLVKYTYLGDGNLDGVVNFDDYVGMDNAFFGLIPNLGWATGDINFDGVINFDDYSKMDQAFFLQGTPLTRSASGAAAVPEPPMCALMLSALACALAWRRLARR